MQKRRIFLRQAGAFALGSFLLPGCMSGNDKTETSSDSTGNGAQKSAAAGDGNVGPIGVQLWSVKDVLEQDVPGILMKLGKIGYKEIEAYPGQKGHYYGNDAKTFKKMVDDAGMKLVSSHVGSGTKTLKADTWQQATLLSNFEALADMAAQTGQTYLTCSWTDESLRGDMKGVADMLNKSGEVCKKAGLQFAYHNHDFEFKKVGNTTLYDYMLDNTDADLVKFEMDMYWVVRGERDPKAFFSKYNNRFPLGHVKDMDKADKTKNTEIGTGSINYADIIKAAKDAGMKHFIVEQETFTRPSIDSMKMDYDYLASLKV